MIIFATDEKIGIIPDTTDITWLTSQFLTKYRTNIQEIQARKAWKTQGSGAKFMGVYSPPQEEGLELHNARINGLACTAEGDIVYSVSVDNCSGIFSKNPIDRDESEGHIIHKNNLRFYGVDHNPSTNQLVASIDDGSERHLALFRSGSAAYSLLTEGESVDENPVWSRTDSSTIFYDSCGIGKDGSGRFAGFSPRSICRLDLSTGSLNELVSIEKHDCIQPREDLEGNLYFIKRPLPKASKQSASILSVLLIPYKILKAIFHWANFFTMRYSGDTLTNAGPNPSKAKEKNPEEIYIEGNLVNVAKTLRQNEARGEKYPGIAPSSWELIKMDPKGRQSSIRQGVLGYDITPQGQIVYSNGKHLVRILKDDTEEIVGTIPLIAKLRIVHSPLPAQQHG